MKNFRTIFFSVILLFTFLYSPIAATPVVAATLSASERVEIFQKISYLQARIKELQALLDKKLSEQQSESFLHEKVSTLASYSVSGADSISLIKNDRHRRYFSRVFELFPQEYGSKLSQLNIFNNDSGFADAFVETLPPKHNTWLYAVRSEMLDFTKDDANDELIVHELAHIISYETPFQEPLIAGDCISGYFEIKGCPPENSYLRLFVDEFWSNKRSLDRAERNSESKDSVGDAYDFYKDNSDEFVSGYAALNPEEDFSEAFMYFVLEPDAVTGETANDKIDFFWDFPEMRKIRTEILKNK